jgi:hypothetical protein
MTDIPTIGGQPTRGEAYAKLLHHLREAQNMAAVLSHLHNTEGNRADQLHAQGWLGIEELIRRMAGQITKLAMRSFQ